MVNSVQIDMNTVTQLPSSTVIAISSPSIVTSDVYTGN